MVPYSFCVDDTDDTDDTADTADMRDSKPRRLCDLARSGAVMFGDGQATVPCAFRVDDTDDMRDSRPRRL
ncbi:MAG: hypothetical protein MPJ79_03685 [Alphaproteobacteria bacterium]|nr:hypothetical protein [Alphaproteobacteria bacterium]MDA7983215.1 hypothetical protein [Alphaproteobacteria bacterium]MDA7988858.1 hypothetical protein [Alphaproteobacteria bacterium]MDA8009338.1 hypothetical protein [Alphaproteobacteria bacterium]